MDDLLKVKHLSQGSISGGRTGPSVAVPAKKILLNKKKKCRIDSMAELHLEQQLKCVLYLLLQLLRLFGAKKIPSSLSTTSSRIGSNLPPRACKTINA